MVGVWRASAVVGATFAFDRHLPLLCQPGSVLADTADRASIRVVHEGYPDRAYAQDGTLVPRGQPGAVISDVDTVVARAFRLATAGEVEAQDGSVLNHPVESLCLHGDTTGAVELAGRVRAALEQAGVRLTP